MRIFGLLSLALGLSGAVLAQQPNTVTTTAFVTQSATAGTAAFQIQFLDASANSTVDAAIGVVGGAGASAATLRSASVSISQGFVVTQYNFEVTVPAAEFTATRDRLLAAQRAVANVNTQAVGWTTSFTVADDDAKLLEGALPGLLEKTKQQAAVMATAIGLKLGKLASLTTPLVVKSGLSVTITATATYLVE